VKRAGHSGPLLCAVDFGIAVVSRGLAFHGERAAQSRLAAPRAQRREGRKMGDFLRFETMLTPLVIQALFWIGVIVAIVAGIAQIVLAESGVDIAAGAAMLILGPLVARIYCEIVIVFFRINDHLRAIQHNTERA
jgi:uncharacterized protein DUF4282